MAALTVITPDLPYPPTGGAKIKSFLLLERLARRHDVSLVSVLKGDDADHVDALREAVPLQTVVTESVHRERGVRNLVRSIAAGRTLNEYRTWSPTLAERAGTVFGSADVIVADHLETVQYVPEPLWPKVVLHTHNAEHMLWRRYGQVAESLDERLGARFESRRIAARERRYARGVGAVLAAADDARAFADLGVGTTPFFPTMHIGDDATASLPDVEWEDTERLVFFLGTLTWPANTDGLIWFLDEVWPHVTDVDPDVRFVIGGKDAPPKLTAAIERATRVEAVGFLEDPERYFSKSRVVVAPLRFGSGMKLKVVEALMRGVPTVTTTVGVDSIDAESGVHLEVADEPAQHAARVMDLLDDRDCWVSMRDQARALARRSYTWDAVAADAYAAIDHVLDQRV